MPKAREHIYCHCLLQMHEGYVSTVHASDHLLKGSSLGAVVKNYRIMLLNLPTAEIKQEKKKTKEGWDFTEDPASSFFFFFFISLLVFV